jgi:hypothetical protein
MRQDYELKIVQINEQNQQDKQRTDREHAEAMDKLKTELESKIRDLEA